MVSAVKQSASAAAQAIFSAKGTFHLQGAEERGTAMKLHGERRKSNVKSPIWYHSQCENPLAEPPKAGLTTKMCKQVIFVEHGLTGCVKKGTSWKNIVDLFQDNTVPQMTEQIIARVENPVETINQRYEGFCGTAAHLFVMAVAMPGEYTLMLQGIFCSGKFDTQNKGAKAISAEENWTTKFKEFFELSKRLICRASLCDRGGIAAVDWMSMSALRNSPGDYKWWGSATDRDDQGTGDFHLKEYQRILFNSSGGLMFNYAGKPNPLPDNEWIPVLQAVQNPYTLMPVAMYSGDFDESKAFADLPKRGNSNHIVVLLGTKGNSQEDCLIWTWASIFHMSCSGFRKLVVRVYRLNFKELVDDGKLQGGLVDLDRIKELKQWMYQRAWRSLVGKVGLEFT